jgi:hypothetical protein
MTDVEIVNKGSGIYKISVFMNGAKYPFERHEVRYSEIYEGQYKYDVIKSECEPNKGKYILSNKKLSIISKEEQPDSMIAILYDDKMIFGFKLEN